MIPGFILARSTSADIVLAECYLAETDEIADQSPASIISFDMSDVFAVPRR